MYFKFEFNNIGQIIVVFTLKRFGILNSNTIEAKIFDSQYTTFEFGIYVIDFLFLCVYIQNALYSIESV